MDYDDALVQIRMWQRDSRDRTILQPTPAAAVDVSLHLSSIFKVVSSHCLHGPSIVIRIMPS